MSLITSRFATWLRRLARTMGITRSVARYMYGIGYEVQYDVAITKAMNAGDVVWDVGANVGHYTQIFSHRIGPAGRVVAFEPSPDNFGRLANATKTLGNVTLLNCGLGRQDGRMAFEQGNDDLGATSMVVAGASAGTFVEIRAGAGLVEGNDVPFPNVIKIDVEGYEHEVILGLGDLLRDRRLRVIGVEVHFSILQEKGEDRVPSQIESLLRKNGFDVGWIDFSHLLASRT